MTIVVSYEMGPDTYAGLISAIAEVDGMAAATMRQVGAAARAAYKSQIPSQRAAKAVTSRQRKRGNVRTVRTGIADRPLGGEIHGRDVGAQAIARWLDRGTADAGTGLIYRTTLNERGVPLPFMHWGFPVPFVRGQKPQHWIAPARAGADAVSSGLIATLNIDIERRLAVVR